MFCCLFLTGSVIASWSLSQDAAGSNNPFRCNIFDNELNKLSERDSDL